MTRRFNQRQRAILYLAADGYCVNCGTELADGWHADHVTPYSLGGPTDLDNGQALCPTCNLKKGAKHLKLRKWQEEAIDQYYTKDAKNFLVAASPGAGKTTFALTLAKQLRDEGKINQVIVVVPSDALRQQWSNTTLIDLRPYRVGKIEKAGFDGIVTTYQALTGTTGDLIAHSVNRHRALVIFDEIHHAGDTSEFGHSVKRAFDSADRRLLLSGTPWRSSGEAIPYTSFDDRGELNVDFMYSYADAIEDGVCRPISFQIVYGEARWARDGEEFQRRVEPNLLLTGTDSRDSVHALLDAGAAGGWMKDVLVQANETLFSWRREIPDAAGLIVAKDKYHAHAIKKLMHDATGVNAPVVVSGEEEGGDSNDAQSIIKKFRDGTDPWIIAVKMIAEGVDIPRLMVGVYATNITTNMFFTQVMGRFIRKRPGEEAMARMYILPTAQMSALARNIESEVPNEMMQAMEEASPKSRRADSPVGVLPDDWESPFIALGSESRGLGQVVSSGDSIAGDAIREWERVFAAAGVPTAYADRMARVASVPAKVKEAPAVPKHVQEKELRGKVNAIAGKIAHHHLEGRENKKDVFSKLWHLHGAGLGDQSIPQLKQTLEVAERWLATGRVQGA